MLNIKLNSKENQDGKVVYNAGIVYNIVALAVQEVEGVMPLPGKKNGISLFLEKDGIYADVSVVVKYGYNVPEIAYRIQQAVKQSVENIKLVKQIQDYSERVYRRCDFNGIVRFDFLVQGETVYLNEINAVPGSLAYYLFCDKTADFSRLLTELLQDTFSRALKNNNLLKDFSSSVLQGDWQNVKK